MNTKLFWFLFLFIPSIVSAQKSVTVIPSNANKGDNLIVSITGTQTNFLSGSNTLTFYYQGSATSMVTANQLTPITNTLMGSALFVQGSATTGAYTYKLHNFTDGVVAGTGNFIVGGASSGAQIVSVSPAFGRRNQNLNVSVIGANTSFTQGTPTLQLIQMGSPTAFIQINSYTLVNDSNLSMNIQIDNNAPFGMYDLFFVNAKHSLQKQNAFEVTWPIGVDENKKTPKAKIYPNPAKEQVTIEAEDITEIQLFDIQGRLVQTESLPEPVSQFKLSLDPILLPKKFYLIKLTFGNNIMFHRLIIE